MCLCRALRPRPDLTAHGRPLRHGESLLPAAFAILPVPQSMPWPRNIPRVAQSDAAPAHGTTRAPTTCTLSGLNHTASALTAYASQSGSSLGQPRKTRFRLMAISTERDWLPAGSSKRFQRLSTSHPPLPGLPGATRARARIRGSGRRASRHLGQHGYDPQQQFATSTKGAVLDDFESSGTGTGNGHECVREIDQACDTSNSGG